MYINFPTTNFLKENDTFSLHMVICIYKTKPVTLVVYHCASGKSDKLKERNALVSLCHYDKTPEAIS